MTSFTLEQLRILNETITSAPEVEHGRIEAANLILALRGHNITIQRHEDALTVLRQLEEELMECGDYRYAATLLLGGHLFNAEPDFVRRIFAGLHGKHDLLLLQGSTSSSKTYSAAAWHYIDWRRWPEGTTVKVAALSEDHLRKNVFAHISDFHKAAQEVVPMAQKVKDTDLFLGVEEAGDAVGFSGVAFQKGNVGTGHFKGYKSKPTRRNHKTLGNYTRLRILGDECVRGDQRVNLADGSVMTIKEMVDSKYSGEVLSFNIKTGEVEPKRVIGWHKNDLRGRSIVDIRGLKVTEDHPVFTELGYVEAAKAKDSGLHALQIQHVNLSSIAATQPITAIPSYWKPSWRRINPSNDRTRKGLVLSRSGPTGISNVEAEGYGQLHLWEDLWASSNRVRWPHIQVHNEEPPKLYGNSSSTIPERVEEKAHNASMDGYAGRCGPSGLVYGRRINGQGGDDTERTNLDLFVRAGGLGSGYGKSDQARVHMQAGPKQGSARDSLLDSRNEKHDGQNRRPVSPRTHIQAGRSSVSREAGRDARVQPADNSQLQDMRDAFREDPRSADMLQGLQSGKFSEARNECMAEAESVYCIDVEDNHNFFCEGICIHNCQQWSGGPFSDFGSTFASIREGGTIKATLCFNPDATSRPVVVMAEPEQGWVPDDIETLYEWDSKRGWHVIRLDAARLENVIQRKEVYRGFQTYEGFMAIMKESGDNGEKYYWACRGFPPVKGSSSSVIPPAWVTECRGEATFLPGVETLVTTDMAYAGIDKPTMCVWRWGKAIGWRRQDGQWVTFRHRQTQKETPRYVLQLDQIIYLEKADQTIMAAEEIQGRCNDLGVTADNVAIDSTGAGLGTASHLKMYWGDVLAVNWGEGATDGKILSEDVRSAKEQYDGLISEMWFTCRRWMDPTVGVLLINPIVPSHPLNTQLTTRRYKWAKEGRQRVEKKDEWKARHQGLSPDEADSFVMGPLLVRARKNILPGLVEQEGSDRVNEETSVSKLESVDIDDQLDGVGGGEEYLAES